jgi:hypothetical protein
MDGSYRIAAAALAALLFGGCATAPTPPAPTSEPAPPPVPSTAPFMPVATVVELMESVIAHAAEKYWGAVQVIIDENGVTENFPRTDEEWEEVWAAAMSIAESGNLLMMAPRAVDNGAWMQFSTSLIEVGVLAAAAAQAQDTERVFAAGEQVYNVCTGCHMRYIPQ